MEKYYVGVDLGTTAVKAVLFDASGTAVRQCSRETSLSYPNGMTVQHPDSWYEIPCELIREVCAGTDSSAVAGIGISSQGISFVPVDNAYKPLSDGISWLDAGAMPELDEMLTKIPADEFFTLTGKHPSPLYTLPKLIRMRKREPELFGSAAMFLMPLDYITARLCGMPLTDPVMAGGTMLYDIGGGCWSEYICGQFGISPDKLAKVTHTTARAGFLNAESQRLTGLGGDTFVAVGSQDQKIAAYGAGIGSGNVTVSLGTAGALEILCDNASDTLPTFRFDTGSGGFYVLEGCVNTFGAAMKWVRDTISGGISFSEMDGLAECAEPGSGGVRFYPHLSGAGTPHFGKLPDSGWVGISLSTSKAELIRSVYEGLACELRANLDAARESGALIERLTLFGGGSRSDIVCKIVSDITDVPVEAMVFPEIAALGAAKSAAACAGEDISGFGKAVSGTRSYEPHKGYADELYADYTSRQSYM